MPDTACPESTQTFLVGWHDLHGYGRWPLTAMQPLVRRVLRRDIPTESSGTALVIAPVGRPSLWVTRTRTHLLISRGWHHV